MCDRGPPSDQRLLPPTTRQQFHLQLTFYVYHHYTSTLMSDCQVMSFARLPRLTRVAVV